MTNKKRVSWLRNNIKLANYVIISLINQNNRVIGKLGNWVTNTQYTILNYYTLYAVR